MKKRRIGRSGLMVSEICLGTMTFGSTCDEQQAMRIMDRAFDAGVDFLDTAEVYPVPSDISYVHRTEEIVGRWLRSRSRDAVLIATKFCGSSNTWFVPPVREGRTALDRHHIRRAIEGSLRRLGTDYVDLYQTHWPDHDFPYEPTLEALDELVQEGLVRYIGCSNETPWGLMKALNAAERGGWCRYESIQNNFSLINRRFEDSLAQVCRQEQISLLPYSPMGGGVLSGKYNQPNPPEDARFSFYEKVGGERQQAMARRFVNEKSLETTRELIELAADLDVRAATLAIAWSKQHDFVASTIVGANTVDQLEDSLAAANIVLEESVLRRIDEITARYPYPMN
jgi:aryl-alcohol dehydrogenase-like predicted oxidoreductase